MSSTSKRQKRTREFKEVNFTPFLVRDEDRLTNLPSCLKTKILSCLPMKDVVRTCVLSRKWKHSWTSVTNLDFDHKACNPTKLESKSFKRFVNRVLLLHDKSCLGRFHLKSYGTYDGSLVNAWIASVLLCKVQEFDLHVDIKRPVFFPQDLFLCKTLVVLKLDARGKVNVPTSICLPVLKTLHLVRVELPDDVSLVNLVSGCPVLEELSLNWFIGKNVGVINITAPALTCLTIISSPGDFEACDIVLNYQVVIIDAPTLEYLIIGGYEAQSYKIKNLNHLIEAELDIGDPQEDLQYMRNPKAMTELYNGIFRAQSLVLSNKTMEAIVAEEFVLPKFCNLTCLELDTIYNEWTYLPKLLESFPCLETLRIKDKEYGGTLRIPIDEVSPSCLLTHLKIININELRGLEYGMKMVGYFLKNAKVLEKLTIDKVTDANFFQKLLMLPRSSTSCKVEVSWHP